MYMGGGDDAGSKFTITGGLTVGEWNQVTFTVADGLICGYVNGYRSGDCAPSPILASNRQVGGLEPLEVGGEDSYRHKRSLRRSPSYIILRNLLILLTLPLHACTGSTAITSTPRHHSQVAL